jgi:hypothetical protein
MGSPLHVTSSILMQERVVCTATRSATYQHNRTDKVAGHRPDEAIEQSSGEALARRMAHIFEEVLHVKDASQTALTFKSPSRLTTEPDPGGWCIFRA